MNELVASISVLVAELPVLAVWGVALVLALFTWRRHRTAAALVLAASLSLLASDLIFPLLSLWLPLRVKARGASFAEVASVMAVVRLVSRWCTASASHCWWAPSSSGARMRLLHVR